MYHNCSRNPPTTPVTYAMRIDILSHSPAEPAPLVTLASPCRDRFVQPFAPDSPWNMAIGDQAAYVPGNIFVPPKAPPIAFL